MSKELFIAAHEQLIEEYLVEHPNATWSEAYEKMSDNAYDRMKDNLADRADRLRQREKDRSL